MAGGGKRGAGKGPWTEVVDLLTSGFGVGVVVVFTALLLGILYHVGTWAYAAWQSPEGIPWATVVGACVLFGVLGQVVWVMASDVLEMASESVKPVARRAKRVADEAAARREEEREREELQDAQGGALSMSVEGEGGELSEVVFSEGSLEVSEDAEVAEKA